MAIRFVPIDRDTPLLLPPNLRDWVPDDHLVHFILDAVAALDLRRVKVNERGTGSEQYPPTMMLALLIYSYATGTFGSRRIEQSTYEQCAGAPAHRRHASRSRHDLHLPPREPGAVDRELCPSVATGPATQGATGRPDHRGGGRHQSPGQRQQTLCGELRTAGQMIAQLELEVGQLIAKAEQADSTPLQDGLTIPQEITRRQERKAALTKARAEIEARAQARYAIELAEHEKKMAGARRQARTR